MTRITRLERQKGGPRRVSVYLDDEFFIGLSGKAASDLRLKMGMEVDPELRRAMTFAAVRESALLSLARREHSRAELAGKLKQKKYAGGTIKAVLDDLVTRGYLDDRRFASFWIERRCNGHPRGRRMLSVELQQRGISPELAKEALDEHFPEQTEQALLIDLIKKRMRSAGRLAPEVFKRRLMSFLARRGFSYGDIRGTLDEHFPDL